MIGFWIAHLSVASLLELSIIIGLSRTFIRAKTWCQIVCCFSLTALKILDSFFQATLRIWIYFNSPFILLIRRHPCNISIFRRAISTFNWSTWNFIFACKNSLSYFSLIASVASGANKKARCQSHLKARSRNSAFYSNLTVSWAWSFLIFASFSLAACLYIILFLVATSAKTS